MHAAEQCLGVDLEAPGTRHAQADAAVRAFEVEVSADTAR
jgi:hypothetical protein